VFHLSSSHQGLRYAERVEGDAPENDAPRPTERALPDGTVTFVLTDVVAATVLGEQAPQEMRGAMVLHDQPVEAVTAYLRDESPLFE
jgi:hypothetical protein